MTIGIAIVVAMVLYLIDRNKVWKQAGKIAAVLILLAVLFVVGIVGWDKYDSSRAAQKAAAQPVPIPYGTAIDCYDAQGNLLPDESAAFDGRISGCGKGQTPKPKSERSRLPKDVLARVEAIEACQKRETNKHYKDDSVARQNFQACSMTNAQ